MDITNQIKALCVCVWVFYTSWGHLVNDFTG